MMWLNYVFMWIVMQAAAAEPKWHVNQTLRKQYYIEHIEGLQNFRSVHSSCQTQGGNIPEPRTIREDNYLKTIAVRETFFIGLSDKKEEGKWRWRSDGSLNDLDFPSGQQYNGNGKNCVMFLMGKHWFPWDCNEMMASAIICEKCIDGYFGVMCSKECKCKGSCNRKDGKCPSACISGWSGPSCQQKEINCTLDNLIGGVKNLSGMTKKFKAKTNISPKPVILGHPVTVKCSDSANNDDLNVTIVNISLFIKHEGSFKRLFTYNTNTSTTSLKIKTYGFQLPGVTTNNFNASFDVSDGKPRHFLTMKVSQALREQISMYKCQFIVIWPNGCTKTEDFISTENVGVECSDICGNHTCEVKEGVATCLCLPGYVNSGPLHCHDIDECKKYQDVCHYHTCVNTNGSYRCECRHGYNNINGQICVGEDDNVFLKLKSSSFKLVDIGARTVMLGLFCTVSITFGVLTLLFCANTVGTSMYKFATTEPSEKTTVRSSRFHYVLVTRNTTKGNISRI